MSRLHMTVEPEFYNKVATILGENFAYSYLYGATIRDGKFLPRTQTGWSKLNDSPEFLNILRKEKLSLLKPPPFNGTPAEQELGLAQPKRRPF